MKNKIKILLRENFIRENIDVLRVDDIDDDELYDSVMIQAKELTKDGEISYGNADLFGVITDGSRLIGATWVNVSSGVFEFHIQIKPRYRGKGYSKLLLDDLFKKYNEMISYRGNDFKIRVNVVNDKLAKTLAKYYGLTVIDDNGNNSVIMSN